MRADSESIRDEKVKILKAIPALTGKDVVRGQFRGYRAEPGPSWKWRMCSATTGKPIATSMARRCPRNSGAS